jgi:hypothetical protein
MGNTAWSCTVSGSSSWAARPASAWPDHHRATSDAMDKMLTGRALFRMI